MGAPAIGIPPGMTGGGLVAKRAAVLWKKAPGIQYTAVTSMQTLEKTARLITDRCSCFICLYLADMAATMPDTRAPMNSIPMLMGRTGTIASRIRR